MKMNGNVLAGVLALSMLNACGTESSQLSAAKKSTKSRAAIAAELAAKPDGENVVWSSASLDGLLGLVGLGYDDQRRGLLETYLGTSVEKSTKSASLLNIKSEGVVSQTANNIWTRKDFILKSEFKTLLALTFKGLEPQNLDISKPVQTAADINAWVAAHTNNMIKNAVTPDMITPSLASLLANALYFKGEWQEKFDTKLTKDAEFKTVNKSTGKVAVTKVPTMHKMSGKVQLEVFSDVQNSLENDSQVYTIRLPYKGNTHAMYISFAGMNQLGMRGQADEISVDATKNVSDVYRKYIIEGKAFSNDAHYKSSFDLFTMPKFTVDSDVKNIQDNLIAAGYDALFQQGALSRMTANPTAQLSFILQKAKIIVNEEGSEAAAVTIGGVRTTSISAPRHLKVNGPFAYAIRDDKNAVTLFEGIVRNPQGK